LGRLTSYYVGGADVRPISGFPIEG
jgi:hypothetical protein